MSSSSATVLLTQPEPSILPGALGHLQNGPCVGGSTNSVTVTQVFKMNLVEAENRLSQRGIESNVEQNPETTTQKLGEDLEVSHQTVERHLAEGGMTKKLQKWLPHEPNVQKFNRLLTCSNLLVRFRNEPFLDRLITVDEKWMLYDNRQRGYVWVDKSAPISTFPKPNLYPKNIVLTVWWRCNGVIHYSFLQPGQTVTAVLVP